MTFQHLWADPAVHTVHCAVVLWLIWCGVQPVEHVASQCDEIPLLSKLPISFLALRGQKTFFAYLIIKIRLTLNVSLLGVESLWGDCTFILADWRS